MSKAFQSIINYNFLKEKLRQEFAGISQLLTSKKSMSKSKDHCVASNQSAGKNDARLCGEAKVLCASVKSNKKQLLLNACAVDDNCITFKCIDKKISSGFYTKTASFHRDITKLIAYADVCFKSMMHIVPTLIIELSFSHRFNEKAHNN